MDEIRDYYLANVNTPGTRLPVAYFGPGYPGIARWRVVPYDGSDSARQQVQWEAAGSSTFDGVVNRQVRAASQRRSLDAAAPPAPGGCAVVGDVLLWVSDRGKADAHDWSAMQQYIADGYDVVSFDGRGLGRDADAVHGAVD